ncbi:pyridoxal phosphate-dependent aminotransferase [Bdellovibrio svalbardensis]|uniref:Pyridoxal phosphate-dependent aminotransferase n=1 Tax=Bdellovibrio svalbardensis TaxID=2972972 RepID=A0ABT6DK76_9BACT|nr:pyridoxal phosphate-dependent aminotransferase [Bdellovibrio svalbardensis]MDG0816939.1 pyridoxal phosphate-dependent aminotransferase [Bdellovibrio svalbardensis]
MVQLSKRAQNLKTSPTLFLVAKAKELAAQGHDVISLTVGEPDWPTFDIPSKAGIEAIEKGITKYTPANGTVELRQAIGVKIKNELGQAYSTKEITVASGAKYIVFAALQMICSPGDEVIIATPYWVSYPTMVELADGVPHIVECGEDENFKITPEKLEKAINARTKGFLFCSPSNPTGLLYSAEELKALADVLRRHPQVVVISDDMYNRLVFDGTTVAPHILQVAPDLRDRTVVVNGGSKAYSMTGWRIGWAAGPEKLITAMADYQSQSTGSPSSISQHAAVAALKNCEPDIAEVVKKLIARKDSGLAEFASIPQFKVANPEGAFYYWVDIKACLGKNFGDRHIRTSKDFCDILLEKFFVATVPGVECGSEGFMRLSFAVSEETMKRAITRMKDFISQLS